MQCFNIFSKDPWHSVRLQKFYNKQKRYFADRTKNTDLKGRLSMLDDSGFGFGGLGSSDKMIKKLTEEINENKAKHENLQKDSRTKMNELQKILGLEVDLDKLITKPNEKGFKKLKFKI